MNIVESKHYESQRSLGFSWDLPQEGLHILKAENSKDALFTFHKCRVEHVSKTLNTLEHIPCSYAQTRTILDGKSVAGLSTRQLRAVENYGQACEYLVDLLENNRFNFSKDTICQLHGIIGKDEAKHVGQFRGHQVFIQSSHYIPPNSEYLDSIFKEGKAFIDTIENIQEKAICTFLFLSRTQLFSDCNKRTASLVMNGILINNGFQPLSIDSENFLEKMASFYESANATEIFCEINNIAKTQYLVSTQSTIPEVRHEQHPHQIGDNSDQATRKIPFIEHGKLVTGNDRAYRTHEQGRGISEKDSFPTTIATQEDSLLSVKTTHKHLLDTANSYDESLKTYLIAKESQVDRLEAKLSAATLKQKDKLKQTEKSKPGLICSLWRGTAWENQKQAQRTRLRSLENRLSLVKYIGREMTGNRLLALATKKLERHEPELVVKHREEKLEAQTQQMAMQEKLQKENKLAKTQSLGMTRTLGH